MGINVKKMTEEAKENDNDFELLSNGTYQCFVYDLEGVVASTGNPMIKVTLKVATGEYHNRMLWTNLVLVPKAFFKVTEFFDAVEYDMDELPEEAETASEIVAACKDEIVGCKVLAVVSSRKGTGDYAGNTYQDVKKVKKPEADFEVGAGEIDESSPF